MSYVIKPLSYILVKEGEKSFSEGQTEISVGDDGAGAYIVIIQDCEKINIPEWQRMVFDEKRSKIFEEYLGGLRSKAKVSINKESIKE